ncbi:curli assembly protein CsgF [Magnetococcales bacterium HHB-1]
MKLWIKGVVGSLMLVVTNTWASEMTHTFKNPSFGGSGLNGSYLLQSATAQNSHKDPNTTSSSSYTQSSDLDNFKASLNRQILNILAQRIISEAFGETGLADGGVFQTDDFTIEVGTGNTESVSVTITDPITGNQTVIEVPRQ